MATILAFLLIQQTGNCDKKLGLMFVSCINSRLQSPHHLSDVFQEASKRFYKVENTVKTNLSGSEVSTKPIFKQFIYNYVTIPESYFPLVVKNCKCNYWVVTFFNCAGCELLPAVLFKNCLLFTELLHKKESTNNLKN